MLNSNFSFICMSKCAGSRNIVFQYRTMNSSEKHREDIRGNIFLVMMVNKWDDVLQALQKADGDHAEVAVYPNADIRQYSG